LEELGPAFIKLGQILGTRPDDAKVEVEAQQLIAATGVMEV
jgi:predicted unusual protein kinase regulating ubiquinone biosynthesis (AarF/ABC1/UbiB family)